MTDKQIIIKDYFNILRDEYGRIYCIQYVGDPKSLIKAIREQNEYIQAKKQECEELKKINNTPNNETWKTMSITFDNGTVKTEVAYMSMAEYSQLKLENTKLKQTLTEIKEIAEKAAKCLYATESDDYTDGYRWLGSIILQKISKCEVENEN